jgi:hypothetical protein
VQDCPLALCDFRTVREDDLVKTDIIFPHYQDEAYEVIYNPAHRWFYKKGMSLEDVIIFKLDDNSETEARCKFPKTYPSPRWLTDLVWPHSAFKDPSVALGAPKRASIEVRAIIMG